MNTPTPEESEGYTPYYGESPEIRMETPTSRTDREEEAYEQSYNTTPKDIFSFARQLETELAAANARAEECAFRNDHLEEFASYQETRAEQYREIARELAERLEQHLPDCLPDCTCEDCESSSPHWEAIKRLEQMEAGK